MIVGQKQVLEELLVALAAGGHCLMIGLPGLGKTLMVNTLAKILRLQFKRIQFTPDLMPSDIIGTDVLEINEDTGQKTFRFIKGPIFANLLLADEINRTPPKTQAALLEAMGEQHVTAGGTTYDLDAPFFVLATQNPIEMEGTYPLPEAQLDRFLFKIHVAMEGVDQIVGVIDRTTGEESAEITSVGDGRRVSAMRAVARQVILAGPLKQFIARIVMAVISRRVSGW